MVAEFNYEIFYERTFCVARAIFQMFIFERKDAFNMIPMGVMWELKTVGIPGKNLEKEKHVSTLPFKP